MKFGKSIFLAAMLTIFAPNMANAQDLMDILKGLGGNSSTTGNSGNSGNSGGSMLGNLLEGIFTSSNITVQDLQGTWSATGPAICFQGEGFLKKAGGLAAASALESKLAPYYQQYGLNNAVLTVDENANFSLKIKALSLKGTISAAPGEEKGVFLFNFMALGKISLGSVKAYVQKTSQSMDVMFDATKLKNLVTAVANFTGISLAKTLGSILDSYDGLCVGFHFKNTGETPTNNSGVGNLLNGLFNGGSNSNGGNSGQGTTPQNNQNTESTGNSGSGVGNLLNGLFNGGKSGNSGNQSTGTPKNETPSNNSSTEPKSGTDRLRDLLNRGKK